METMREFFRGWKRKVGCFTLGLACLFAVGWVRSLTISDDIRLPNNPQRTYFIGSADGRIFCSRWSGLPSSEMPICGWKFNSDPRGSTSIRIQEEGTPALFEWCGFYVADLKSTRTSRRFQIWMAPYWSIVIPLTLLSACLLLKKPRQTNAATELPK